MKHAILANKAGLYKIINVLKIVWLKTKTNVIHVMQITIIVRIVKPNMF